MCSVRLDDSLEKKADQLREKAEEAERATNVEKRVQTARNDIKRITTALSELEQAVRMLKFHSSILTDVFDDTRPAAVDDALDKAQNAADVSDEELLEAADEDRLMELKDDVDAATDAVEDATSTVQYKIDTHVDRWQGDIDAARELDRIITGGKSDFSQVLYNMGDFLSSEIDNPSNNPSGLANRWERLKDSWDEHAGKHGWDAFREEYDLSDSTIQKLRKFTGQKSVYLSEFSEQNLKEIKNVEELESAIKLRIDPK